LTLSTAPINTFDLRHEGLRRFGSNQTLIEAQSRLKSIQAQQAIFDDAFYTDQLPAEDEIKRAILTLREGDAWYRIFQGGWRNAIKLHRRLEKTKTKRPGSERLKDLEALLRHQDSQRAWNENPALRSASGPHFNGVDTPLADLAACSKWISDSSVALESVEIPLNVFDPVKVSRVAVTRLLAEVPLAERAAASLTQFDSKSKFIIRIK
jgi:hypothetical protein